MRLIPKHIIPYIRQMLFVPLQPALYGFRPDPVITGRKRNGANGIGGDLRDVISTFPAAGIGLAGMIVIAGPQNETEIRQPHLFTIKESMKQTKVRNS